MHESLSYPYFLSPTGAPATLLTRWEQGTASFAVIVSEAILTEYYQALTYPHVQAAHKRSDQEIDEYINSFRNLALLVSPTEAIAIVKADPDDDKFFSRALAGRAEYIVSGDRDLRAIGEYRGIQILSPRAFLTLVEKEAQAA